MSSILPLFPLSLVVFPGEKLNLHIFEPRYRALVNDCEASGGTFGVPPFIDEKMQSIGTELKLLSIEKVYEDGKMDIKTEGVGIFKIDHFYREAPGKPYAGAKIMRKSYSEEGGDIVNKQKIFNQIKELFKFMNIQKALPKDFEYLLTFRIAQHVGFNIYQKYEMLQLETELERQNYMMAHLDGLLPVVKEMELLRQRIQMNGHFKNIIPPKF